MRLNSFILISLTLIWLCVGCTQDRHHATTQAQDDSQLSQDELVPLIKRAISDAKNRDRFVEARNSHGGQLLPKRFWEGAFPYTFTGEKLLSRGWSIVEPLRHIAADPARERKVRSAAAHALGYFDPATNLDQLLLDVHDGRMSGNDLYWRLKQVIPIGDSIARIDDDETANWIRRRLDEKGFEGFVLEALDDVMRSKSSGLSLNVIDDRLIRWLNRLNDQDIDDVLARNAPTALEFRNAQLAKGYDPLDAFESFRRLMRTGRLDEGVNAVYSDPADQAACRLLFQTVFSHGSSIGPPPDPPGWRDRVRKWYFDNRNSLRYDRTKRRFTVDRPQSARL